jgi:hypothetical protein
MATPDYIPPGMRWNGNGFEPIKADNLENAIKMISQKDGQIESLTAQVKEWEAKFAEYWSKGLPPVLKAKYETIEIENKHLKEQLAAQSTDGKAKKAKPADKETPKAEV